MILNNHGYKVKLWLMIVLFLVQGGGVGDGMIVTFGLIEDGHTNLTVIHRRENIHIIGLVLCSSMYHSAETRSNCKTIGI